MSFILYLVLISVLIGMGLAVEKLLERIIQLLESIDQRLASLAPPDPDR